MGAPKLYPFQSKTEFVNVLILMAEPGSTATVYRQYGKEGVEIVRGAVDLDITRQETIVIDYEIPQGYVITYWAVVKKGSETQETARAPLGPCIFPGDVLFDLSDPRRGMVINVESFKTNQYGISRDVQRVWGRKDPVVISGVREYPAGELRLYTLTLAERQNFLDIINNGSTVAFSPHSPSYGLDGVIYFAIGNVTEERTSSKAIEPSRRWILEVQQVSQPPANYRYPNYGKTWREFRENTWRTESKHQWWEAIA